MKMFLKHAFFVTFSLISFIFVFYSAGKFMVFVSMPHKIPDKMHTSDSTIMSLLLDTILIATFMLQHSLMVLPPFKQFLENVGLQVITRSIYNLLTSIILLVIVKYWRVTYDIMFWNFDTANSLVWYIFSAVHLFAWSVIYTGCLFMDIPEILGVKQVYYNIRKMPNPMLFKSHELQKLYGHTRHPSLSAFLIIFWIYPTMSFDRFLLATILTIYMCITWRTDRNDFSYQKVQYFRKTQELSALH